MTAYRKERYMKKILLICLACSVLVAAALISWHNYRFIDVEESEEHFRDCFTAIENKISEYGFTGEAIDDCRDPSSVSAAGDTYTQSVSYVLTPGSDLNINLENKKGFEFREIEISIKDEDFQREDLIEFFCEVANKVIGAKLEKQDVDKFIEPIKSGEKDENFQILNSTTSMTAVSVNTIHSSWISLSCYYN